MLETNFKIHVVWASLNSSEPAAQQEFQRSHDKMLEFLHQGYEIISSQSISTHVSSGVQYVLKKVKIIDRA